MNVSRLSSILEHTEANRYLESWLQSEIAEYLRSNPTLSPKERESLRQSLLPVRELIETYVGKSTALLTFENRLAESRRLVAPFFQESPSGTRDSKDVTGGHSDAAIDDLIGDEVFLPRGTERVVNLGEARVDHNNGSIRSGRIHTFSLDDLLGWYKAKGLVGEEKTAILQTLGAVQKMHFGIESFSGSGKSYTINMLIDLLPKGSVMEIGMSSDKALLYAADAMNSVDYIYISELQKAMRTPNSTAVEIIKTLTENKDVTYRRRDEARDQITTYTIVAGKGVMFTLALENAFKYDTETARRVFTMHTDPSEEQTRQVILSKAARRHAYSAPDHFAREGELREHIESLIRDPVSYENPFADYIAQQIPLTIRARSYVDYVFELMNGSANFQRNRRVQDGNNVILDLADVYNIHELYWGTFVDSIQGIPYLGRKVYGMLKDQGPIEERDIYRTLIQDHPSLTAQYTRIVLDTLQKGGFAEQEKQGWSAMRPIENPQSFDWLECFEVGRQFMAMEYPSSYEAWMMRHKSDGKLAVTDFHGDKIELGDLHAAG